MKRVLKSHEPDSLTCFRRKKPAATWEQLRNQKKRRAYHDCRTRAIADQGGLCAYCEQKITSENSKSCRIEHVHPKSDISTDHNWALDWQNILACCAGGEKEGSEFTLPDNLSCDAHKNHLFNTQKLSFEIEIENELISPLNIPTFPNLFILNEDTGYLEANPKACTEASIDENKLKRTIEILNLNCDRLASQRIRLVENIDENIGFLREGGSTVDAVGPRLIQRYFNETWPEFFTTIRCCLGKIAEDYLSSIGYEG